MLPPNFSYKYVRRRAAATEPLYARRNESRSPGCALTTCKFLCVNAQRIPTHRNFPQKISGPPPARFKQICTKKASLQVKSHWHTCPTPTASLARTHQGLLQSRTSFVVFQAIKGVSAGLHQATRACTLQFLWSNVNKPLRDSLHYSNVTLSHTCLESQSGCRERRLKSVAKKKNIKNERHNCAPHPQNHICYN